VSGDLTPRMIENHESRAGRTLINGGDELGHEASQSHRCCKTISLMTEASGPLVGDYLRRFQLDLRSRLITVAVIAISAILTATAALFPGGVTWLPNGRRRTLGHELGGKLVHQGIEVGIHPLTRFVFVMPSDDFPRSPLEGDSGQVVGDHAPHL
jgi:hypothetical protein